MPTFFGCADVTSQDRLPITSRPKPESLRGKFVGEIERKGKSLLGRGFANKMLSFHAQKLVKYFAVIS